VIKVFPKKKRPRFKYFCSSDLLPSLKAMTQSNFNLRKIGEDVVKKFVKKRFAFET
jgi:hypothetical protein